MGASGRLRPILMTSCAMIAGMIPMALGWNEGGQQTAPLGRAVIGGLLAATLATLVVLPTVFAIIQRSAGTRVGVDRSRGSRKLTVRARGVGQRLGGIETFRRRYDRFRSRSLDRGPGTAVFSGKRRSLWRMRI